MLSLQQLNQQTGFLPCCDCELFFVNLAICICHNYESIVGNTTLLLFMQLSVLLQELYELQQLQAILKCLKCDSCKLFCWIYNRFLNSSELLLTFFVVARQTAIVKQTIHSKSGTTLFLMMPITCIVKFAKWIVCHSRPFCQSSNSFWPFLQDNSVFFAEVAKIWNFSWVMPTNELTQEFWSLLNIDNHTTPYDQYLANRMKALTNRTEDC